LFHLCISGWLVCVFSCLMGKVIIFRPILGMTLRCFVFYCFSWFIWVSFHVDKELMAADSTMSLLRIITPRAIWPTRLRCRFHLDHRLFSTSRRSSHRLVHTIKCPIYYYGCQYNSRPFQHRSKIVMPRLGTVHNFSSSLKPLLFTDDLLQKYIRQLVAEWNQMKNPSTGSGQPAAVHCSKRLPFLEPIVSRVMQHQQYSASITELEDIIFGMCTFT